VVELNSLGWWSACERTLREGHRLRGVSKRNRVRKKVGRASLDEAAQWDAIMDGILIAAKGEKKRGWKGWKCAADKITDRMPVFQGVKKSNVIYHLKHTSGRDKL